MAIVIKGPDSPWSKSKSGSKGVAFWPFIFMTEPEDKKLLIHEKHHLKQQVKGLLVFFYIKYVYYSIRRGYWDNPYEVEAREVADEWERKQK